MAFCPACGEEAVDTFCEACLRKQEALVSEVKPFSLVKCSTCDRIRIQGQWQPLDDFPRLVEKAITFNKRALIADVQLPRVVLEEKPKEFTLPVLVVGTVSQRIDPYEEEYEIVVPVEYEQCDRCSMAASSYFEGTLQLRNPRDEVVTYIERTVQRTKDVHITNARDVRGGIDFEFTDQQWLLQFARDLHKRYGGEIKIDSKLITYDAQRSKKVYRLTALLRLSVFWTGDVVETDKKLVRVTKMGQNLRAFDLRRRKNTSLPCPSDKEVAVHETEKAVLSSVQPKPMILDPETYQEVPLAHALPDAVQPGAEIVVVEDLRGKWHAAEKLAGE